MRRTPNPGKPAAAGKPTALTTRPRRRRAISRKPAKSQHGGPAKPQRNKAPSTARQASTLADLHEQVSALARDLAEAREQQTATSRLLDVTSRAAFDLQAVFETLAESTATLCGADRGFVFRFDGEVLRAVAGFNPSPGHKEFTARNPIPPGRQSGAARAALERRTIHIHDVLADPEYSYRAKNIEQLRTVLAVPIIKGNTLLGVILIYRLEKVRPFTDRQIALVETFANHAAMAIENVRLFKEIETRNRDLTEALEQQAATAEVFRAMSEAPNDAQPVFDAIVRSAPRLISGSSATVTRLVDQTLHIAAFSSVSASADEAVRRRYPTPLERMYGPKIAIRTLAPFSISDTESDPGMPADARAYPRTRGYRTPTHIPMLRPAP